MPWFSPLSADLSNSYCPMHAFHHPAFSCPEKSKSFFLLNPSISSWSPLLVPSAFDSYALCQPLLAHSFHMSEPFQHTLFKPSQPHSSCHIIFYAVNPPHTINYPSISCQRCSPSSIPSHLYPMRHVHTTSLGLLYL